jgi:hypothetical protein
MISDGEQSDRLELLGLLSNVASYSLIGWTIQNLTLCFGRVGEGVKLSASLLGLIIVLIRPGCGVNGEGDANE